MASENGVGLLEDYILKKMVYVNSANHGYSEILLDKHLAMFGNNNAGKTASLAGTKLLLFPEVDFHKCEEKFKFEGRRGRYSKEESYEFYFPDARSFLVLEVENPEGTFCMVLYKTNNYGYGRFFVPCHYKDMRPLFWNAEGDVFAEGVSVQSVSKFAKENDGIQVTDQKEITYLMYDSFRGDRSKKRFCILPLKDARPDSIAAFRNIYQLAFDTSNTETDALPDAIATLLEMGRGRDEERLDVNLTLLADEHSKLVEKQNWLQSLQNAKPQFERVKSDFDKITKDMEAYSKSYHSLDYAMIKAKNEYLPKYQEAQEKTESQRQSEEEISNEIKKLNDLIRSSSYAIKHKDDVLSKNKTKLNDAKKIIGEYGSGTPVSEVIENLLSYSEEKAADLKTYEEEDGTKKSLQSDLQLHNRLGISLTEVNKLIKNAELSFLDQLNDPKSASVLISLNRNFERVAMPLNDENIAIIKSFTNLFDKDGAGYLTFLDKSVMETQYKNYDPRAAVLGREREKKILTDQIRKLDQSIKIKNEAIKHNDIDKLISDTRIEAKKTLADISLVTGMDELEKEIAESELIIKFENNSLKENSDKLNEKKQKLSKVKGEYNQWKEELDKLNAQNHTFIQITKSLGLAHSICIPLDLEFEVVDSLELATELSADMTDIIHKMATNYSKAQHKFSDELRKLTSVVAHPSIDPHKDYHSADEFHHVVKTYDHAFTTLEYDLAQHSNEIRSHNRVVSSQLNELREAKQFLTTFVNEINSELNNKHVSNLSEIKLILNTDKRFESLLATLEKHNIQDDSLLEEQFYIALAKFVESYFNKKTRRLKMHDIISSINYQYILAETGEVVTKSQSGGTTSTITAFVLSVLLKRITPPYVSLRMPIIVDEISTLDFKNTSATIKQIADHGFSIFCATPSFSGFIIQNVGRWIMIDRVKVRQPMVSKCHMNILPKDVEGYGEISHEA